MLGNCQISTHGVATNCLLDRDHPQGPGKLEKALCDVQFNAFIPVDTNLCPYLVFISHGVHQHPPPPPTKAPEQILQGVKRIIAEMRDPSLTTGMCFIACL